MTSRITDILRISRSWIAGSSTHILSRINKIEFEYMMNKGTSV